MGNENNDTTKNTLANPPRPANTPHPSAQQWEATHVIDYPTICGTGAAIVNVLVTFPINKLSFRQQVESTNIKTQINIFRNQLKNTKSILKNTTYIYRGCSIPLLQKCISNSIMYSVYSDARNTFNKSSKTSNHLNCLAACSVAALGEAVISTPLERTQAILQDRRFDRTFVSQIDSRLDGNKRTTPRQNQFNIYRQVLKKFRVENNLMASIRNYYKAFGLILIRNTSTSFIYFTLRDYYKVEYSQNNQQAPPSNSDFQSKSSSSSQNDNDNKNNDNQISAATRDFLFGILSGCLGCTFSFGLNTLRIKSQTDINNEKNLWQWTKDIYHKNSDVAHRGFYYGWRVAVFRSGLSWGITNFVYEFISKRIAVPGD